MTSSLMSERERERVLGPELIISATDDASNASAVSHLIYSSSSPFASDAASSCALQDIRYGPCSLLGWLYMMPAGRLKNVSSLPVPTSVHSLSLSLPPITIFPYFFSYTFLPGLFFTSLSLSLCVRDPLCAIFSNLLRSLPHLSSFCLILSFCG